MSEKLLAIYDFDGTVCQKDSTIEFWKYCVKHSTRAKLFLTFIWVFFVLRFFRIISKETLRQYSFYFLTPKMVRELSGDFIKKHRQGIFGWPFEQIQADKDSGLYTICITGLRDYLESGLLKGFNFDEVLCSKTEKKRPWKFETRSCLDIEKLNQLSKWAKDKKVFYRVVKTYSDSKLDYPIMAIAEEKIWINYKTGTRTTSPLH